MSHYPYGMPPPAPTDPTNVTGKRVGAWFIDAVIYVIVINVVNAVLGTAPKFTSHDFGGDQDRAKAFCDAWRAVNSGYCGVSDGTATTATHYVPAFWVFLALVVVYIVVQGLLGASVGKLAVGLRVVKADGTRAGIGASAVRTVLWVVDAITCALPIVGGIAMLSTRGHRRVGDMAAGTYVVDHDQVGRPVILPGDAGWGTYPSPQPPYGYGQPGGFPPPGPAPVAPSGQPANPWAPTSPVGPQAGQPGAAPSHQPTTPGADRSYEADVPTWDEARKTYIQYDSARQAWLEFDQRSQQWVPIST